MSSADLVDSSSAGSSRKRQPNACNNCRRRKIRCDSAARGGEACSNCISLKIECHHTVPKKKRGPPAGRSAQLKSNDIQALTSSILSSVPYDIPKDENELRRIFKELASYIRTLQKELAMVQTSRGSDLGSPESTSILAEETTPSEAQDHDDIDELSEPLKQLRFSQSSERYAASGRLMLIKSGIETYRSGESIPNHNVFKRPVFWDIQPWQITYELQLQPLIFPPQDLLDHLIDLWFTKTHPYFPIFHRPTFERSVISGLHYHNRDFGEALLAVCAISSRHSDDPRTFTHDSLLSAGFMWIRQVNPVPVSFTEASSLAQVQKLILYIMFMYTTSMPYPSLVLTALGIRLLQDVGAHRKKNSPPTASRELWKRAFWILNFIDLSFSVNIGTPRSMTSDDYDVEFPIECDDEFWEQPDELAFKQPPGKLCQLTYWIHMLKLASILESVQRAMSVRRSALSHRTGPDALQRRQQTVLEIDKALNDWLESIPVQCHVFLVKWDPQCQDTVLFHQSTMLSIMYFFLRMETFRNDLATPSSLEISVNAAHSCVLIMEAHYKRDYVLLGPQMLGTISNSGIVLLIGMWRAKRLGMGLNIELEMADVVKCMLYLERFEKRVQIAGRFWDTILNVIHLSGLTDVYNLVRRQSFGLESHETAFAMQFDSETGGGPYISEQLSLNSIPPTANTYMPTSSASSPFTNSPSDNVAYTALQGPTHDTLYDLANAQQPDWASSGAMDISQGDWAEYMESVDEVLRSLKSS
ncbi:fungal-specific transcription factor domain-containing protein [Lentinula boryana]|uniref:Fungal-specific transcription factor domain-containing protein n=1 Tax=Lentinula boryana TaxID=40481 RepID=A0ABQ8QIK7_9AGAR|nr:fungal-specific transcription factor domain-containing protein [Lentinula boryana]